MTLPGPTMRRSSSASCTWFMSMLLSDFAMWMDVHSTTKSLDNGWKQNVVLFGGCAAEQHNTMQSLVRIDMIRLSVCPLPIRCPIRWPVESSAPSQELGYP